MAQLCEGISILEQKLPIPQPVFGMVTEMPAALVM
jgi:hypothetical protein